MMMILSFYFLALTFLLGTFQVTTTTAAVASNGGGLCLRTLDFVTSLDNMPSPPEGGADEKRSLLEEQQTCKPAGKPCSIFKTD